MNRETATPFPAGTARFRQVVDRCGRPDVHLSLIAPAKDRVLQELKRRGRVMTIRPAHRGGGTDYGVVGLWADPGVQFLVFDRSLGAFAGKRVVGIDYSLLARPPAGKARAPAPRPIAARDRERPERRRDRELPKPVAPPAPPPAPTTAEIKSELRRTQRLLTARQYAAANARITELMERIVSDS